MEIIVKEGKNIRFEGLPPLISKILANRGIDMEEQKEIFFNPGFKNLTKPENIKNITKIRDFIKDAVKNNERIAIYGDYDVDGITASIILYKTIKKLGGDSFIYIPDRFDEGYGITKKGIDTINDMKIKKIVSVDCGITSYNEVDYAKSIGIDIVITDHHLPQKMLPDTIIVDPKLEDENTPYYNISGAGIALFLGLSLLENKIDDFTKELFALSSLGTVADVVPLLDDNRIITILGLDAINTISIKGIDELKEVAGLKKKIEAHHIAFALAPRLNAAGRMENALLSIKLFTDDDPLFYAKELDRLNWERRNLQDEIFTIANSIYLSDEPSILLYSNKFNRGINGIVASKMVEKYNKVTIILEEVDGVLHGSGRSISSVNIMEIIKPLKKLLLSGGGHKMACGVTLKKENFDNFKMEFNKLLLEKYGDIIGKEIVKVDERIDVSEFNFETYNYIEKMKPFGMGNPKPIFFVDNVMIKNIKIVKEKYKFYYCENNKNSFTAIDWSGESDLKMNVLSKFVGVLYYDTFRNQTTLNLKLERYLQ